MYARHSRTRGDLADNGEEQGLKLQALCRISYTRTAKGTSWVAHFTLTSVSPAQPAVTPVLGHFRALLAQLAPLQLQTEQGARVSQYVTAATPGAQNRTCTCLLFFVTG